MTDERWEDRLSPERQNEFRARMAEQEREPRIFRIMPAIPMIAFGVLLLTGTEHTTAGRIAFGAVTVISAVLFATIGFSYARYRRRRRNQDREDG